MLLWYSTTRYASEKMSPKASTIFGVRDVKNNVAQMVKIWQ